MNIVVTVELYGEDYIFTMGLPEDAEALQKKYKDHLDVNISWEWSPFCQSIEEVTKQIDERIAEYEEDHS